MSSEHQRSPWSSALLFYWQVLKQAVPRFGAQEVPMRAAALAFCMVFSLPPILLIVIWTAGQLNRDVAAREAVFSEIGELVGEDGAHELMATVEGLEIREPTWWAKIVAVGALLSSASLVLVTMRNALNRVFGVEPSASRGLGIWRKVWERLVSVAMLASISFILSVSLVVSALVAAFGTFLEQQIGRLSTLVTAFDYFLLDLGTMTILFALLFRYLPDVRSRWRDVWFGAFVTAGLFAVGENLIGFSIGRSAAADLYDAAGSILVLMLWVYYASVIFLFGGAFTAVRAELLRVEAGPSG